MLWLLDAVRPFSSPLSRLWLCFYGLSPSLKTHTPPSHPDWIFITKDHSLCPTHIHTARHSRMGQLLILPSKWQAASLAAVQVLEFHLALTWGGMFGTWIVPDCQCYTVSQSDVNTDIHGKHTYTYSCCKFLASYSDGLILSAVIFFEKAVQCVVMKSLTMPHVAPF